MDGYLFRLIRKASAWTQYSAATHFGVSRETISNWERNAYAIPADKEELAIKQGNKLVILFEALSNEPLTLSERMAGVLPSKKRRLELLKQVSDALASPGQIRTAAKSKEDKQALAAYTNMRKQPGWDHARIIAFWQHDGFTPSAEAQDAIVAAFPDIMEKK